MTSRADPPSASETAPVARTTLAAPILIVDDSPSKRFALRAALLPLGHRIVEADSGTAALRCVMAEDFAVILLDVHMPVMDGFETAALLRQRRESEMTPILFITAYASDDVAKTDHYAGGAVDFIFAPIPPSELRSKVSFFAHVFLKAQLLAARALEVQAAVDHLRLLTDAAPIGIFQTDGGGRYQYTNPCWTEITGIPATEALGADWASIVDPAHRALLGSSLAAAADLSHRFELARPGAAPKTLLMTWRPVPDGGAAGLVGTLADVTAETRAEAAMSAARDTALNASAMQREFAASASHELRTPTTSIIGYLEEVLDSAALTDPDRRFLEIVYRNAKRLSRLIDDLLIRDESEIGASLMQLEPTEVMPVVERVVATFSAPAQRLDVRVVVELEPDAPPAMADPHRLEQALTNLVSNALKFTPPGGLITVGVRATGETVSISISDTGVGIHPADIDLIFARFYRTQTAVDSAVTGSGLGLAIAQAMIQAQGGEVTVASRVGAGSTFTVTLPVADRNLRVVA